MARQKLNVEKVPIRFHKGDVQTIKDAYPEMPYNAVIRAVIHTFAKNLRDGTNEPLRFDPNDIRLGD